MPAFLFVFGRVAFSFLLLLGVMAVVDVVAVVVVGGGGLVVVDIVRVDVGLGSRWFSHCCSCCLVLSRTCADKLLNFWAHILKVLNMKCRETNPSLGTT